MKNFSPAGHFLSPGKFWPPARIPIRSNSIPQTRRPVGVSGLLVQGAALGLPTPDTTTQATQEPGHQMLFKARVQGLTRSQHDATLFLAGKLISISN